MNKIKTSIYIGIVILSVIFSMLVCSSCQFWNDKEVQLQMENEKLIQKNIELNRQVEEKQKSYNQLSDSIHVFEEWAKEDGYNSINKWVNDIKKYKTQYQDYEKIFLQEDSLNYLTEEQLDNGKELIKSIKKSYSVIEIKSLEKDLNLILEEIEQQKDESLYNDPVAISSAELEENVNSFGLTQQSGVNYYNGRVETYYSSNVLYHYRTPEWTLDNEGFYRTSEGYYVVAASDMEQGTIFEGSKGTCIVLDCGCNSGVTDYYVAW